jgi:hypothetical protein
MPWLASRDMRYVNAVHRAVVLRVLLGILLTGCAEAAGGGGGDVDAGAPAPIDADPSAPDADPSAPDASPSVADARGADAFRGPATFEFQDGAEPTAAYAGTRDTELRESEPSTSLGGATGSEIDADSPDFSGLRVHALVRWDVSAIPAGARVTRVRLALQILDWPGNFASCEIRPLRRDWDEATATWRNATASVAWETAGALGNADHVVSEVVGALAPRDNGPYTIDFTQDGIDEVQRWVDDPSKNFGLVVYDSSTDGMEIATRESAAVGDRPRLIVDVE